MLLELMENRSAFGHKGRVADVRRVGGSDLSLQLMCRLPGDKFYPDHTEYAAVPNCDRQVQGALAVLYPLLN